ncbi:MAG TPA: HAD-IA family hydrolase [Candidatus Saccharimonadales bacterium]|jgi:phosphoglycolate phosphatase|nr:HAD-IA family hydrolase [Candidatus Saccharimonadales bacterium]
MILKNRPIPIERIKLLIFDLDGTLVDSRLDLANSINATLRHCGKHELPNDVIASYIGDGAPMLVRRALGDPDDESYVQKAIEFFLLYYREHKLDNTYVYSGVKESLDAIRARYDGHPVKMAVLSNKPVFPSRAIVGALGLGQYFFQIYGGNSFHTKKPDPAGVEALLREASVEAGETVIIGDSDVDVVTARNSGIYSIGVKYGLAPHTLNEAPPDVLVDEPIEVGQVFGM